MIKVLGKNLVLVILPRLLTFIPVPLFKKSKSMIFNKAGRLINTKFTINGESLEPVKSFCYLGFEVVPSGTTML